MYVFFEHTGLFAPLYPFGTQSSEICFLTSVFGTSFLHITLENNT